MMLKRFVVLSIATLCTLIISTVSANNNDNAYNFKTPPAPYNENKSEIVNENLDTNNIVTDNEHACPNLDENIQRPQRGSNEFSLMIESLTKEKPNYSEAFFYAKDAAKENFCNAFGYLGTFYMEGIGIKVNYNEAYKAFYKGYKCNDLQSIYGLSKLYKTGYIDLKGQGGYNKELFYLQLAADKEYVPAQYDLAIIILNRDPTNSDGIELLKAAANGRYAPAIDLYYKKYATSNK